jgi:hypothetical protein
MVLTPKQARENWNQRNQAQLKKLEVQIDNNLKQGNTIITVLGGLDAAITEQIIQRYNRAGWDVDCQRDPAKGDYLLFNEHKEVLGFRPYGK